VEQKPPVGFAHAREQSPELLPEIDFFAGRAPRDLVCRLPGRKMRQQGTLISLKQAENGASGPTPVPTVNGRAYH